MIEEVQRSEMMIRQREKHERRRPPYKSAFDDKQRKEFADELEADVVLEIDTLGEQASRLLNNQPQKDEPPDSKDERDHAQAADDAPDDEGHHVDITV